MKKVVFLRLQVCQPSMYKSKLSDCLCLCDVQACVYDILVIQKRYDNLCGSIRPCIRINLEEV